MSAKSKAEPIRIDTLPPDKLDYLGKQLDRELARLQQSAQILEGLAQEYQTSSSAVEELKDLEDGTCRSVCTAPAMARPGQVVHASSQACRNTGPGHRSAASRACMQR